jgi:hypothetical protein
MRALRGDDLADSVALIDNWQIARRVISERYSGAHNHLSINGSRRGTVIVRAPCRSFITDHR